MPTDGSDFARRRPLYGKFYVAIKNGASGQELAPLAIDGVVREIGQRPLVAFLPALEAMVSTLGAELLSADAKQAILSQRIEGVDASYASASPSTRDICDCVLKVGLEAIASGSVLNAQEAAVSSVRQLVDAWCLSTVSPEEARSIDSRLGSDMERLAASLLVSSNGRPTRNWRAEEHTPVVHNAESLRSEVIASIEHE